MSRTQDVRRFLWLLRTYLAPHWPVVALLLATSYLATALAALFPVLMAPILDLALGTPVAGSPTGAGALNLSNLGASFFRWIGVHTVEDRFRAILWLCAAYVAAGFLKGWLDFGNFLLALWIRVRAAAALQLDLFQHLLGLSMPFFTAHRTVRLMRGPIRRLATDQFSAFAELATRFQEAILSIRVVKSVGAEVFELARVSRAVREVVRVNVKFGIYKHVEEPARTVVNYFVEATILTGEFHLYLLTVLRPVGT